MHLEGRSSTRTIARGKTIGRKKIIKQIHTVTSETKSSEYIKETFNPSWNGVLSVDGKYINVFEQCKRETFNYCWICGIDFPTKDLPHYLLHDEEGKIDMVIYFKELKRLGYPLKVLISDDNHDILAAAKFVYGDTFTFQLCTFHYMRKLERLAYPMKNDFLVEMIRKTIHSRSGDDFYRRLCFLFTHHHCFKKRYQKTLFKDFQDHVKYLSAYIYYQECIPRTNIEIENLFRQVSLRMKTIGRFYHYTYARDYLNTWALMRRFTPFTDCRKSNTYRNGKAPLELAGCDINGKDYLNL